MPVQSPMRGATPTPRNVLAAAVPYRAPVGAPPNFIVIPKQISFWGNYDNGDCVTAEEAFTKACNNPEIFISEAEVIAWATSQGVLNGAGLTQVMSFMQTDGFTGGAFIYDDGPYFSVDFTNAGTLQSAISQGPVKLCVAGDQLDTTWWAAGGSANGGVSGWFATGYQQDTGYDHCVTLCGYGTISWLAGQLGVQVPSGINGALPGYALFTWDSIGIIDVPSMTNITCEAWLRQPTSEAKHVSLAGCPVANFASRIYFLDAASLGSGWGTDHVFELAWENGWVNTGDLTAKTAAAAAAPHSALAVFPVANDAMRVYFLDASNHVNELAWENGWVNTGDLTAKTNAAAAAPGSALAGFPVANFASRVYFLDASNHVNELAWENGWVNTGDLTAKTGASAAAPGSALAGCPVQANFASRVYFLDANNHVNELAWENGWVNTGDLTAKTGASAAAPGSAMAVFPVADYAMRVYFLDASNHVNELAWENGWVNTGDLTAKTNASAAAPGSALAGCPVQANFASRVYFLDANNHVNELAWENGWVNTGDLTAKTNAAAAAPGSPLVGFPVADYAMRVYFLDASNHLNELAWENNAWVNTGDLTAKTGAPSAC